MLKNSAHVPENKSHMRENKTVVPEKRAHLRKMWA